MNTNSVTDYYQHDHKRLDELFEQFRAQKRTDLTTAVGLFNEFAQELQRHIAWEEQILFPLFEQRTGITSGPTVVMRQEHRQIQGLLGTISLTLQEGSVNTDADETALLTVLGAHNQKEEFILYPAIDRVLGAADLADVFARMGQPQEDSGRAV